MEIIIEIIEFQAFVYTATHIAWTVNTHKWTPFFTFLWSNRKNNSFHFFSSFHFPSFSVAQRLVSFWLLHKLHYKFYCEYVSRVCIFELKRHKAPFQWRMTVNTNTNLYKGILHAPVHICAHIQFESNAVYRMAYSLHTFWFWFNVFCMTMMIWVHLFCIFQKKREDFSSIYE